VLDALDGESEVVFVDDRSIDATPELLADVRARDGRCKIIRLARNFGHQVAISAGLDAALGDAVIVMDGDLQDPPEVIPRLVARWREGFEVVYAVREQRGGVRWWRRTAYRAFYRLLRRLANIEIPLDAGDFRLVDRRALDAFKQMPERTRYVRGMISWVGFRQVGVAYEREGRYAGESKYSLLRLLHLALRGIVGFSTLPLRLAIAVGATISTIAFIVGIWAIAARAADVFVPPGWTSTVVVVSFLGGVQLLLIGILGLYIGNIYEEVKARPLYVIDEAIGLELPPTLVGETLHRTTSAH
jgi:glycosyltransferase involved in cell wall biosynthesis